MSFFRLIHVCCLAIAGSLVAYAEIPTPTTASAAPNPLVWDALEKKVDLPGMTNLAYFTFWVTNTSAAEATIASVEAECDCTVVEARKTLPWQLAPGASGPLNVRVNIRGRFGVFNKTVTVNTSHGVQVLTVDLKIPLTPAPSNVSVRQQDVLAAKADRQAVFRGNCAVCHATPATALSGAALFGKACGICHTAEQRAEMVPDLAKLKPATDAGYWRTWITSGKVGSLMPAFAQSAGGILDTNQIESLVAYLLKEFPSGNSTSSSQPLPAQRQVDMSPAPVSSENSTGLSPQKNK